MSKKNKAAAKASRYALEASAGAAKILADQNAELRQKLSAATAAAPPPPAAPPAPPKTHRQLLAERFPNAAHDSRQAFAMARARADLGMRGVALDSFVVEAAPAAPAAPVAPAPPAPPPPAAPPRSPLHAALERRSEILRGAT